MREDHFTTTEQEAAKWERDYFAEPPERPDPSEYMDEPECDRLHCGDPIGPCEDCPNQ